MNRQSLLGVLCVVLAVAAACGKPPEGTPGVSEEASRVGIS